jgi:surfeit locus 1 family protein
MPITAFALGCWQVQRLNWKAELIARFEDRLIRDPLELPPRIDPTAIKEFDYRRILATGTYRHDQEMLIGPRIHEGENGYLVVTPLERKNGSTILINRGWIPRKFKDKETRPEGLPMGEITVEGLLREPFKKNMFTPDNNPGIDEWYFPDVAQMARLTGAQPVWVEETLVGDFLEEQRREARGIPIGRSPEVHLRNNHAQYIFTWYVSSLRYREGEKGIPEIGQLLNSFLFLAIALLAGKAHGKILYLTDSTGTPSP